MTKTPEQMAEEYANLRCYEQGAEFIVWCMCKEDFLAGYKAATDKHLEQIRHLEMELQQAKLSAMKLEAER